MSQLHDGYVYVDIIDPETSATEHIPIHWCYWDNDAQEWKKKPGVPWPSEDPPKAASSLWCTWNGMGALGSAVVPTSWHVWSSGEMASGTIPPIFMPAEVSSGGGDDGGDGGGDDGSGAEPPTPALGTPANVTAQHVADFLDRGEDQEIVNLASLHLPLVCSYIRGYVRDVGVTVDQDTGEVTFPPELVSVAIMATARLVLNPAQLERETADGYTAVGGFHGFTIAEKEALHRYRRRAG